VSPTPPISFSKAALLQRGYQAVTAEHAPHGRQLTLLRQFITLYDREKLLPGGVPRRLCDCCPNREECWAGSGRRRHKREGENGSVMLPWIGEHYQPGRNVAVLAINPNIAAADGTDIFMEYGISWEHHDQSLSRNKKCDAGSWFAYRALRSAAVLQDAIDGRPIRDREPRDLIKTLHSTARLQAVKCVPRGTGSEPTNGMWRNCPPFLLLKELDIVRPAALLVLGAKAAQAVAALDGFGWLRGGGSLGRGRLERLGRPTSRLCGIRPPGAARTKVTPRCCGPYARAADSKRFRFAADAVASRRRWRRG
jgi:hypothetical protein